MVKERRYNLQIHTKGILHNYWYHYYPIFFPWTASFIIIFVPCFTVYIYSNKPANFYSGHDWKYHKWMFFKNLPYCTNYCKILKYKPWSAFLLCQDCINIPNAVNFFWGSSPANFQVAELPCTRWRALEKKRHVTSSFFVPLLNLKYKIIAGFKMLVFDEASFTKTLFECSIKKDMECNKKNV